MDCSLMWWWNTLLQGFTLFVAFSDTICFRFECSYIGLCKIKYWVHETNPWVMVTRGVCLMYLQNYFRVISLFQKRINYSKEEQQNLDRGRNPKESSSKGSIPKMRMALFHWCQRVWVNHIYVIDVYWWGEIVTLTIDVEYALSTCWHQCWYCHQFQRGRLLDHVVIDANGLIDWFQRIDWFMIDVI